MAITYYEAEDVFKLKSSENPIDLEVKIGDGQGGGYLIFSDTKLISSNKKATIKKPSSLIDKWLNFVIVVKDKLKETNWTSVTVSIIEDGTTSVYGPFKREVAEHLDTVCYSVKIKILEE